MFDWHQNGPNFKCCFLSIVLNIHYQTVYFRQMGWVHRDGVRQKTKNAIFQLSAWLWISSVAWRVSGSLARQGGGWVRMKCRMLCDKYRMNRLFREVKSREKFWQAYTLLLEYHVVCVQVHESTEWILLDKGIDFGTNILFLSIQFWWPWGTFLSMPRWHSLDFHEPASQQHWPSYLRHRQALATMICVECKSL